MNVGSDSPLTDASALDEPLPGTIERAPRRVAIGFGSSLGSRRRIVEHAVRALDRAPGLHLIRASRLVRTPPMRGGRASGWFLNAVAVYRTELSPREVLHTCRTLEARANRRRSHHWGDRTLDLDVLVDEDHLVDAPDLQVPHPAVAERRFVLEPLLEVWPDVYDLRKRAFYRDAPEAPGPRPTRVGVLARPR